MFESYLRNVVQDARAEGEWLLLLSLMEYVGCRKIMKGVPYTAVSAQVLRHIHEESFHALVLREAAEDLLGEESTWGTHALLEKGWRYFSELDRRISEKATTEAYAIVSWAIERRALRVYPTYLECTRHEKVKTALQQILAQEANHKQQFDRVVLSDADRALAVGIEGELWDELVCGLQEYTSTAQTKNS